MEKEKHPLKRKKWLKGGLIVLVILIIIRIALPYVILHYANKSLAGLKGYYGRIDDINLALIRGAYKINKIYLHKKDSLTGNETEFFDAHTIDLSVQWGALLDGRLVGELEFQSPTLRFTKDKTDPRQLKNDTSTFQKLLDDFMPLKVNRFEVLHGVIKYIDQTSKPPVDVYMSNIHLVAENLSNVKSKSVLPSTVTLSSDLYGGTLDFDMQLDPLSIKPTFDFNAELRNTRLVDLNPLFKAYAKFDVNKGVFGLFAEGAAKEGKFVGYVKPVIKDLDILGPEDKDDPIFRKFWEATMGLTGFIFKNHFHDQIATKVPLEGTINKTRVNIVFAVVDILWNAFIQALKPSIDEDINIKSVNNNSSIQIVNTIKEESEKKKGFIKNLFHKNKDKEDKDKDNKKEKKQK